MSAEILLITDAKSGQNLDRLCHALEALGPILVMAPAAFEPGAHASDRNLVIVDATYVKQAEQMIARICHDAPHARVVVVTASPNWQRARSAFEAGAMDYLSKNMPQRELRAALEQVLNRKMPRR